MTEETARVIFFTILGIGAAAWTISLVKAIRMGRPQREASETFAPEPESEFESGDWDEGTVSVRGDDPSRLSKSVLRALVQFQVGVMGSLYKFHECDDGRILMKKTGPLICNQPPGYYFTEAEFHFERSGHDSIDATYRLGYARLVRKLRMLALGVILFIGLPVMCLVATLIWIFVIPSPNPAVRWQVFQTCQMVHALWPPYLFLGMNSIGRRRARTLIENIITSAAIDTGIQPGSPT